MHLNSLLALSTSVLCVSLVQGSSRCSSSDCSSSYSQALYCCQTGDNYNCCSYIGNNNNDNNSYKKPGQCPYQGRRKRSPEQAPKVNNGGGYNPGNGGYNPGNGGYNPGNGGYNPGNGGYNPGNGGYNPGNGGQGFNPGSNNGGYNPGNGGYNPGNGGYYPGNGHGGQGFNPGSNNGYNTCYKDSDCPGPQKCCQSSGNRQCTYPQRG